MEKSAEPAALPAKEEPLPLFNRVLKFAAYPVSAVAGWWMVDKEVHDSVYHNLKRYGAFDDILKDLKPENEVNVKARINGDLSQEAFLEASSVTKNAYSHAVGERMKYMGLGSGVEHFVQKWNYISRGGQREVAVKGMAVSGIAIGAILTMANSKFLSNFFSKDDAERENSR